MGIIILIFVLLILGFFTYAFAYWYIRVNNFEIELRNDGLAKQKICQTYFDKMRKIILTQAQIKDDYLNSFNDIFVDIMEGRYGDKNSKKGLFNMITESNPNFSDKLFKKTMVTIDAQRNSFQYHQEQLIEIDKKHKIFRSVFPNVLVWSPFRYWY